MANPSDKSKYARYLYGLPLLLGLLLYFFLDPPMLYEGTYDKLIKEAARKHGISAALVKAVIRRESRFRRHVRGAAGEIGLMQLMPGSVSDWSRVTKQPVPSNEQLFTPETNIDIGTWYLARCMSHYKDYFSCDMLALAEYNAGYSRVKKWKPDDPLKPFRLEDIGIESTRLYVKTILGYRKKYEKMDETP